MKRARAKLSLKGGRADQARAPVEDVVTLLTDFQDLVLTIGRDLGGEYVPDEVVERSCRIELVGLSFGSVAAELELASETEQVSNPLGLKALVTACLAFSRLRDPTVDPASVVGPDGVVAMDRFGAILDRGYGAVEVSYQHDGYRISGVLDRHLRSRLLHEVVASVEVEDVTVSGMLFGLEDRPSRREKTQFAAELLDDAGQPWSVRFRQEDTDLARGCWKRRVVLTGTARYSRVRRPVLTARRAGPEPERLDPEGLRRARGAWTDLYRGQSLEAIVSDMR